MSLTFEQFIGSYNFGCNEHTSSTIRIYYDASINDWFDLNAYDFSDTMLKNCKMIFSRGLLGKYVDCFYYDEKLKMFCIWLVTNEEIKTRNKINTINQFAKGEIND